MRRAPIVLMMLLSAAALAQKVVPQPAIACTFDTAAHTDTLSLELSLQVYRDDAPMPDKVLTQLFGAMIRPRLVVPASVGALFAPGAYDAHHMHDGGCRGSSAPSTSS